MIQHVSEEDLIAYQLGEGGNSSAIADHLEVCPACAQLSESIAETLRVFSADAVPEANLDHAWQRLHGSLPALSRPASSRSLWRGRLSRAAAGVALVAGMVALARTLHVQPSAKPAAHVADTSLLPGPLSAQPRDPALAAHLESAERLLTEVGHSTGPLDQPTQERAQQLLLTNALYVQRAQRDGDTAEASVLEALGRTLTTLNHEPPADEKAWHVRMEMSTDGLLLDIRILEQNDSAQAGFTNQKEDRP